MPASPPPLILASESRYRRALLDRLGLTYTATSHQCDEDVYKGLGIPPDQLAVRLARAKADSLAEVHPDALILASDQVAALGETILSKPRTEERAVAQLMQLQGTTHRLLTAVCLRHPDGRCDTLLDAVRLTMRPLTEAQARVYVQRDQPLDCAGSYKIEALGIALFASIEAADHTSIIGMPMMGLVSLLSAAGHHPLGAL